MQFRHWKSALVPKGDDSIGKEKVTAVTWSPDNCKIAVCTANGVIALFNERGEEMEKFSTGNATNMKSQDCCTVRGLAFSPDSDKLGVAQSGCIVLVYKFGLGWGGGKSTCNNFTQHSPVTTLCWPTGPPNDLVFGLMDGKIRIGKLTMNSSSTLYGTDSYVTALAGSPDGKGIVSSHVDGSIHRFFFGDTGKLFASPSNTWLKSCSCLLVKLIQLCCLPALLFCRNGSQPCPNSGTFLRPICSQLGKKHCGCWK